MSGFGFIIENKEKKDLQYFVRREPTFREMRLRWLNCSLSIDGIFLSSSREFIERKINKD